MSTTDRSAPPDADIRRSARVVPVYSTASNEVMGSETPIFAERDLRLINRVHVPPRDARAVEVPAGHVFRIVSVEGPQVGDLNIWNANDLHERFFSGKTRALHGTHVTRGDRLWSVLPYLRPLATITRDTLEWYGYDADGAGVHDVIGTRCDPYTHHRLTGETYHNCCHSNLTRALADASGLSLAEAEPWCTTS